MSQGAPEALQGQRLKRARLDVENGMVATQLRGAAIRSLLADSVPLLRMRGPFLATAQAVPGSRLVRLRLLLLCVVLAGDGPGGAGRAVGELWEGAV